MILTIPLPSKKLNAKEFQIMRSLDQELAGEELAGKFVALKISRKVISVFVL